METYHQEIGRAGRDGARADCVIFRAHDDYGYWCDRFYGDDGRGEIAEHKIELAAAMNDFCTTAECRHALLVEYFCDPQPRRDSLSIARHLTCREACDVCDMGRDEGTQGSRDVGHDPYRDREGAADV